jgi:hypothetical protein
MEHKPISMPGYEGLYEIYEDGSVYSYWRNRFLKPAVQYPGAYGYIQYFLQGHNGRHKWWRAHQLVAHEWIGPIPAPLHGLFRYEVNHKDLNKRNNHYSNLEYITHQQNILHARQRLPNWSEGINQNFSHSIESRLKMANAKKKRINVIGEGFDKTYQSVEELCKDMGIYRRKYNRIINGIQKSEYTFKEIHDEQ